MNRVITMSAAAIFSCAIAATAQTQQPGQTQGTDTQRQGGTTGAQGGQGQGQGQTTTGAQAQGPGRGAASSFIGCVERGSTPNAYLLNVVEIPGAGGSTAARGTAGTATGGATAGTGATGAAGATAGAGAGGARTPMVGHRMELVGGTNIASHVGHKVEITGMVVPQGNATGGAAGQSAADMRVNVTNVRMIEATCTPAAGTRGTTGTGTSPIDKPAPQPAPAAPGGSGNPSQPDPQR